MFRIFRYTILSNRVMDADDWDIEVNLPPELVARAERLARERRLSLEELCRYLIEVGTKLREPDPGDTRAEILRALEKGKFGRG